MEQIWRVVGGADKGGILVRAGRDLKSAAEAERLSTGAKIKELALEGDRLKYELKEGTGPSIGWVSLKLKDKELVVAEEGPDGLPARKMPTWKKITPPRFEFTEMKERAGQNQPGDYYGMKFPHSKEQMLDWGAKWLTQAFITTGVMTGDNEVTEITEIKDITKDVSGGAGLKNLLKVKYKKDKPYLQTDLFVKLPHEPKGSDRYYVSVMWGHDRPETMFNIWLSNYVPFKVPKVYFCDINKDTTNFILITEQIKFASKGTTEFGPGDIEPAYDKIYYWEMANNGVAHYTRACKNLGKMAAYHKTGRLHPEVDKMFPMPDPIKEMPKGLPGVSAGEKKEDAGKFDRLINFLTDTAVKAYPPEVANKNWLQEVKDDIANVKDFQAEIYSYCAGCGTENPNDYVVLTHNNLQVDNCIYFRDDANELDVGMLDWGILACGPFINSVQGGCLGQCFVDLYVENYRTWIQAAVDSYHEEGGPKLDLERMFTAADLLMALSCSGIAMNTMAVLKDVKLADWKNITDLMDPKVQAKWNGKIHSYTFKNSLLMWQKLGVYETFRQWQKDQGLPAGKKT
mmetsp:Transcript_50376/g.92264  ORF Transcript_50376/g.92264 Transcript_50376/m.92264 type:complete len:570 (+) Transcript_50376:78-1787(+)